VRNDGEVEIGSSYRNVKSGSRDFNWLRLEIEFTADGTRALYRGENKQGVRGSKRSYVREDRRKADHHRGPPVWGGP